MLFSGYLEMFVCYDKLGCFRLDLVDRGLATRNQSLCLFISSCKKTKAKRNWMWVEIQSECATVVILFSAAIRTSGKVGFVFQLYE